MEGGDLLQSLWIMIHFCGDANWRGGHTGPRRSISVTSAIDVQQDILEIYALLQSMTPRNTAVPMTPGRPPLAKSCDAIFRAVNDDCKQFHDGDASQ